MIYHGLDISRDRIEGFCQRNHVQKLSLFGSILRDDFRGDSDIDILVEFAPGYTPGLSFFTMQEQLSELFGRPVDLSTPGCLSHYFRDEVLRQAETLYVAP